MPQVAVCIVSAAATSRVHCVGSADSGQRGDCGWHEARTVGTAFALAASGSHRGGLGDVGQRAKHGVRAHIAT